MVVGADHRGRCCVAVWRDAGPSSPLTARRPSPITAGAPARPGRRRGVAGVSRAPRAQPTTQRRPARRDRVAAGVGPMVLGPGTTPMPRRVVVSGVRPAASSSRLPWQGWGLPDRPGNQRVLGSIVGRQVEQDAGRQAGGRGMRLLSTVSRAELVAPVVQRNIGVWVGLALIVVIVGLDIVGGRNAELLGLLVSPPIVAASFVGPNRTVAVGVVALGAAVGYGRAVGVDLLAGSQGVPAVAIVAATVLSGLVARVRVEREGRLRAVTRVAEVAQRALLGGVPPALGSLHLAVLSPRPAWKPRLGGLLRGGGDPPRGPAAGRGCARQGPGRGAAGRGGAGQLPGCRPGPPRPGPGRSGVGPQRHPRDRPGGLRDRGGGPGRRRRQRDRAQLWASRAAVGPRRPGHRAGPPRAGAAAGAGPAAGAAAAAVGPGRPDLAVHRRASEARARGGFFPLQAAAAFALVAADLQAGLETLWAELQRHVAGQLHDDVALLLIERSS
jgi:sigma-B regulation protein RsbU (phosphoserine phosphatase)